MALHKVLDADDLWIGEMRGLRVAGRPVLLLRVEEGVFAYEDRCAHLGVRLSEGSLSGSVLTCRAHQYQYDVRSGRGVNPRAVELVPLTVLVQDGGIFLDPAPNPGDGGDEPG